MNNNSTPSGNVLQRIWWWLRDRYHQLKPCRFSLLVAVIAAGIFLKVAQGTEILRTVGEGMAGAQAYGPRVAGFFAALMAWALCSWYAARVLLNVDFPGPRRPSVHSVWWERHMPRMLGIAPLAIVGLGFMVAASSYDSTAPAKAWLHGFAGLCALLAIALYIFLIFRRQLFGLATDQHVEHVSDLGRTTVVMVRLTLIISLLLFVVFALFTVSAPQWLGMGTILFLAAISWIGLGSLFVYFGGRWQFPVISFFVLLALLFSFRNDNHIIRTVPPQQVTRADVIQSFKAWYALAEKNDGAGVVHPLYLVATEGGGIRAAYWTAIVLGSIQDTNPTFAPHLFAISGVSGGSLGGAVFNALLAEPNPNGFKLQEKAHEMLSRDFLSPALAAMLYPDLVQRFLPFPIPTFDRGRALEMAWEKGWRDTIHNDRFASSFVDLWTPGPREWMPALFLNGTSVEKGNRIVTTNLRLTTVFLDAEDAADKLGQYGQPATKAECNIPLSTAAHMSARFTFVSPAGRFPDGSHVVDGGYFENSGAVTALEIATRIKDVCSVEKINNVDVKVIMISNDPRKGSISIAPAKPAAEPPGPKHSEKVTTEGRFMGEVMDPLYTLLNTRNARGTYAQKAIAREQRRFKAGVISAPSVVEDAQPPTKDIVYFRLHDTNVPLPLGWMLSAAAAQTMRDQVRLNDKVVQNGEAMEEILRSLPTLTSPLAQ